MRVITHISVEKYGNLSRNGPYYSESGALINFRAPDKREYVMIIWDNFC